MLLMSWIVVSLLAASVMASISVLDKMIMGYARSRLTLPLLIGFAQTSIGILVTIVTWLPEEATWEGTGWSFLSGALFGLSAQLHMRVLFSREVSRTIPVTEASPVFVALIAVAFLGESLAAIQWAAIVATVTGAAMLSLGTDGGYRRIFLQDSFYILMLGAFIMATANVTSKVALNDHPVLFTHGLRMLSLGIVFLAFNLRATPWRDVRSLVTRRSPALLLVSVNELAIANAGLLLMLWALSMGPVSLVAALIGTRAFFVVVYSTALAMVWKGALGEKITTGTLAVKVGSTALIVVGVTIIAI